MEPLSRRVSQGSQRPTVLAVLVLVIVVAASGCAGSTKTTSTTATTPATSTHAAAPGNDRPGTPAPGTAATRTSSAASKPTVDPRFLASAEAICTRLNAALAGAIAREKAGTFLATTRHNANLELAAARALGRLRAPTSLAVVWRLMSSYRQTLAQDLSKLVEDAKTHNNKQLQQLSESKNRAHSQLTELANANSFKECSHIGPGPTPVTIPLTKPKKHTTPSKH